MNAIGEVAEIIGTMPIIKKAKHDHPFLTIDKRPLENPNLSWRAKGLLTYLISRPDDWEIRMTQLAKVSKDGDVALRAIMHELRCAGHASIQQIRSPDGLHAIGSKWIVSEDPIRDGIPSENLVSQNLCSGRDSGGAETLPESALTKNDLTNTKNDPPLAREPAAEKDLICATLIRIERFSYLGKRPSHSWRYDLMREIDRVAGSPLPPQAELDALVAFYNLDPEDRRPEARTRKLKPVALMEEFHDEVAKAVQLFSKPKGTNGRDKRSSPRIDRNIGTANEGASSQYEGIGKIE